MKTCQYCGATYADDAITCSVDGEILKAGSESQPALNVPTQRGNRCPGCGAVGDYSPAVELRGSFSWPVFIVGGFFAVLFRNAGRRRKVKCNQCGHLFYIRTPLSNLSLLFFWILILLGVAGIVWWLVGLVLTVLSH